MSGVDLQSRDVLLSTCFNKIVARYEQRSRTGAVVWVNGKRIPIAHGSLSAEETVLDFLRLRLNLTSCKLGCGEGGCGACTVMVSSYDEFEGGIVHRSVNACLTPILSLHGSAITTAEGICSATALHPIQQVMSDSHGSQCGFCTPGIVMSMYSKWMEKSCEKDLFLKDKSLPEDGISSLKRLTVHDIEDALDGNLCRCTGYRPIIDGFSFLTAEDSEGNSSNPLVDSSLSSSTLMTANSVTVSTAAETDPQSDSSNEASSDASVCATKIRSASVSDKEKEVLPMHAAARTHATKKKRVAYETSNESVSSAVETQSCLSLKMTPELQKSLEWMVEHEHQQKETAESLHLLDTAHLPLYFKTRHLGKVMTWITPTSLEDFLIVMETLTMKQRRFKLVHGNTERHIERVYKRSHVYPLTLISTAKIQELCQLQWRPDGVSIGASYPINRIAAKFAKRLKKNATDPVCKDPPSVARILSAYLHQIRWFAGCQIRNVASLGGNIATACPISDLNPLHLAAGVVLTIAHLEMDAVSGVHLIKTREKKILDNFFQGYRRVDLLPNELIVSVFLPFPVSPGFHFFGFKQSRRREDDIAIINAGISVDLDSDATVKELIVSYGGMAPITIAFKELTEFWKGRQWTLATLVESLPILENKTVLDANTPGGQVNYRMRLARNFFFKFFFQVAVEHHIPPAVFFGRLSPTKQTKQIAGEGAPGCLELLTAVIDGYLVQNRAVNLPLFDLQLPTHPTYLYHKEKCKGLQHFGSKSGDLVKRAAVGEPNKHMAGDLHVTGKAIYLDDMPLETNELHAFLLTSTEAHANIMEVDASPCQGVVGFVDFVDHKDVRGSKMIGAIMQDEEVFATKTVVAVGQPIGIVLADSHEAARDATFRIRVKYEKLPPILTIEDAILSKSFHLTDFEGNRHLSIYALNKPSSALDSPLPNFPSMDQLWECLGVSSADSCVAIEAAPILKDPHQSIKPSSTVSKCGKYLIVSGGVRMGGQEHFYLETQCCRVAPSENDEMVVFCSTQDPAKTQSCVAAVTGIAKNRITSKCKRMGGGFGGKETRSSFFAAYTAVATQKLRRPIRMVLDRDTDFQCAGQRHSFLMFYKVAVEISTKKFVAADLQLYNDAGWSTDLSAPVMERALFHCDNCYYIPNIRTVGRCCKTNLPSNTAFRGFGGPQSLFLAEVYAEHCAAALGCQADAVREANFYKPGDTTHYGYLIEEAHVQRMWTELKDSAEFEARKQKIEEFNKVNIWNKRGLSIIPSKFGMSFTKTFMNQAGSLVHVYTDGTVLVSHTGTEMGQGLHTKVAQVAATVFDIPLDSVYIAETSTDKVPNGLPTAASSGSDLNGMATMNACNQILERLEPYLQKERDAENVKNLDDLSPDMRKSIFKKAAMKAHMDRINLSANGFYATPNINYSFKDNTGRPFHYLSYGMACTEVEVDTLTGNHTVIRSDIIQDVGASLNPAIDIGQVEGAFVQGLGLFTLEEIITLPNGVMFNKGPALYKIPAFGDIPADFRVTLLEGVKNPVSPCVYSSKGVGEPPLFLASSAFFAIRDAVEAKRLQLLEVLNQKSEEIMGKQNEKSLDNELLNPDESLYFGAENASSRLWFSFNSPATSERICNASNRD